MNENRRETFFDGFFAILVTITVLEMDVPRGKALRALTPLLPVWTSYVLGFLYLEI